MLSPYFQVNTHPGAQRMTEILFEGACKQGGIEVYYIPKTINNLDKIFGEDSTLSFDGAAIIEMYIKDAPLPGSAYINPMGFNMGTNITLQVSVKRFNEIRTPKLMNENGYTLLDEEGNPIGLDVDTIFSIESEVPMESDLLYLPIQKEWYKIKYVESRAIFFQLGKLNIYELNCELTDYSHESFNTGKEELDAINKFSGNALDAVLALENGFGLTTESGEAIIDENYSVENSETQAANQDLTNEVSTIIDWSEMNPLIVPDSQKKW